MAEWTTSYVNDLPDSCFAVVKAGGTKDSGGKTVPRDLRILPYKDATGAVDLAHLRNALARLPQADLNPADKATATRKLEAAATSAGIGDRSRYTASYLDALPDSAFALILPGGHIDRHGKTAPRDLRRLHYRDAVGHVDGLALDAARARLAGMPTLTRAQAERARDTLAGAGRELAAIAEHPAGAGEVIEAPPWARARWEQIPAGDHLRAFELCAVMIRDDAGPEPGRTLEGRIVPFGQIAEVSDNGGPAYRERFVLGAFRAQIDGGHIGAIPLRAQHNRQSLPLAKTSSLEERPDGLYGQWHLPKTSAANDALELVRSDTVRGLSVGFRAVPGGSVRGPDGVTERRRAHVDHVALTEAPSYAGAGITAVRGAESLTEPGAILDGYRARAEAFRAILDHRG